MNQTGPLAFVLSLLFVGMLFAPLPSCITPRTTSPEERAIATEAVAYIELAITVAWADHKLDNAKRDLAMSQCAALRIDIAKSANEPISLSSMLARATTLSIEWLGRDVSKEKPAAAGAPSTAGPPK